MQNWIKAISEDDLNFDKQDWKLYHGAALVEKMRAAVFERTGFRCSAGVAHNKMLAKLACGVFKPNKQTLIPMRSVEEFFKTFPLKKVRNLGGKLGEILTEEMNCTSMNDISLMSERLLQQKFDDKTGSWLYWYCRGIDSEPVTSRLLPKSVGCNKNFPGATALDTLEKIFQWLQTLCDEVEERLQLDKETVGRLLYIIL